MDFKSLRILFYAENSFYWNNRHLLKALFADFLVA